LNSTRTSLRLPFLAEHLGDVIAASAAVHIHPNTFRYRLKRPAPVAGIDLHDPEAGFEAMPQLRLRPPDS
jgi:DNA-binding PucR family transcriptional regulator